MIFLPINKWINDFQGPLVVGGPCSAESEIQLMDTCKEIAKDKRVQILRAGIWKPRTRPGAFEGVGEEGLKWFKNVKEETGLKISCEVANAGHVELALKHGVDVLWIGARTTVNPFSVQEIADSLRGVDIPIMVKNPINPDLALWCGSIERLYNAGLNKIVAIHRGFATHEKTKYRNAPIWEIPIELKRKYPELPIISDPSHIAGNRDYLFHICQKALDLDFDGWMIESHNNPSEALSDPAQQVTPKNLRALLDNLELRSDSAADEVFDSNLEELRRKIDRIDTELIDILKARFEISKAIGNEKKLNGVTALQVGRMDAMINNRIQRGTKIGLEEEFMNEIYHVIHNESVRIQAHIMNDSNKK